MKRFSTKGLIVDNFAGGGGASEGIERALGRSPDFAINHDAAALTMHAANHPSTSHHCESVWRIDPRELCAGRPVDLAWFSPDCKDFSKAKGGKPKDGGVRGLAWVAIRWAKAVRPACIVLENVEEFQSWGPLLIDGTRCPERKGETFTAWTRKLERYGYTVEWREMRGQDYGAPTSRKRLFVIARCDGQPIVWPEPTHGPGREQPFRTAGECIDWSLPCPSIFLTREQVKERKLRVRRPLSPATMRRIARGVVKFAMHDADPFIIPLTHQGDSRVHGIREPVRTVTGANRGELAFVAPSLIQTSYGERPGQAPRIFDLQDPLTTIVAGGVKHGLVQAFLAKHYGDRPTGGWGGGSSLDKPTGSVTTKDHHALVTSHLTKFYGTSTGSSMRDPVPTITSGGEHVGEVRAFLTKYYGQGTGAALNKPAPTLTTKDRLGLVTVHGTDYQIVDIGMRMLTPRELFRAQGFGDDYIIDPEFNGKPMTKTAQVRMVGNSVCPDLAAAIVRANVGESQKEKVA